jgi:hypothetical protein
MSSKRSGLISMPASIEASIPELARGKMRPLSQIIIKTTCSRNE